MRNRALAVPALLALLSALPSAAEAQQASLQGIVAAAGTGRPLEGVSVVLERDGEERYGALTDRNGFYQIGAIRPGTYVLRGRLVGTLPHVDTVTFAGGVRMRASFRLDPDPVVLQGITVSAARGAAVSDMGRQLVTPGQIRMVPTPGGTGDLATYLQTLPGVATTGDRGGQIFVRGGTPAENLVLVDGIPIFQPFHILGFFSVFPEDLVSSADFYASGFGARYHDRTASVLDVRIRDGNPKEHRAMASVSPFIAEALVEGPIGDSEIAWLFSARRSLVEETSNTIIGSTQPLTFQSQLLKATSTLRDDQRCSMLALHTDDRGRIDPEQHDSHVSWGNVLFGLRCVTLRSTPRLLEVNFAYSRTTSEAVTRGASAFESSIWRAQYDVHGTSTIGSVPLYAGFQAYLEGMKYDLAELFGTQASDDGIFGASIYVEADLAFGRLDLRPGVVLVASPGAAIEPRLRASLQPFGRPSERLQAAFGLYHQSIAGTSDTRDVGSVFTAWMSAPDDEPLSALHTSLGWQQQIGDNLRWSTEGYYKQLRNVPVPVWRGVAEYTTKLGRADGQVYGVDTRVEYTSPRLYGFIGYGYGWTEYEAGQAEFADWFGEPVQRYHPPHDRRHQVNAVGSVNLGRYKASARWQFGSGLPFTRPLGFDEAFDYTKNLHDPHLSIGTPRLVLDRPLTGRLPMVHRLDVSLERSFDLPFGKLLVQAGAINAYDRRNMFFYDLYTARRADQLPLAPYVAVTLRGK